MRAFLSICRVDSHHGDPPLNHKCTQSYPTNHTQQLGYNKDPTHLQSVIRKIYQQGTSKITVAGTTVIPVPMFDALDGTDTRDYEQRVEPSIQGGHKLATQFITAIQTATRLHDSEPRGGKHTTL
jgi:hypothetical protein